MSIDVDTAENVDDIDIVDNVLRFMIILKM